MGKRGRKLARGIDSRKAFIRLARQRSSLAIEAGKRSKGSANRIIRLLPLDRPANYGQEASKVIKRFRAKWQWSDGIWDYYAVSLGASTLIRLTVAMREAGLADDCGPLHGTKIKQFVATGFGENTARRKASAARNARHEENRKAGYPKELMIALFADASYAIPRDYLPQGYANKFGLEHGTIPYDEGKLTYWQFTKLNEHWSEFGVVSNYVLAMADQSIAALANCREASGSLARIKAEIDVKVWSHGETILGSWLERHKPVPPFAHKQYLRVTGDDLSLDQVATRNRAKPWAIAQDKPQASSPAASSEATPIEGMELGTQVMVHCADRSNATDTLLTAIASGTMARPELASGHEALLVTIACDRLEA